MASFSVERNPNSSLLITKKHLLISINISRKIQVDMTECLNGKKPTTLVYLMKMKLVRKSHL